MAQAVRVLALFAHPDDAEFLCAGTLAHLASRGAELSLVTLTSGDCGSAVLPAEKISRIRQKEAERSARMVGATYACLGEKDLSIFYDRPTLRKVMELVRRVSPSLVMTHPPADYMVDHETTSRLAQTACFGAMAPNYRTRARSAAKPLRAVPHLYYAEPFGGRDVLGQEVRSTTYVDISATFVRKEQMLACHESQQAWLQAQQNVSENFGVVRQMAARAGQLSGFQWAEGFRQHLGQGFPQDNLLASLLGNLVRPEARLTSC
jgi:LmbE family N-acetylglucosaminyl deacetylase